MCLFCVAVANLRISRKLSICAYRALSCTVAVSRAHVGLSQRRAFWRCSWECNISVTLMLHPASESLSALLRVCCCRCCCYFSRAAAAALLSRVGVWRPMRGGGICGGLAMLQQVLHICVTFDDRVSHLCSLVPKCHSEDRMMLCACECSLICILSASARVGSREAIYG